MKKTNTKIVRYIDGDFNIDIVITKDNNGDPLYEAWLSHKKYGISEMMFGSPEKQPECIYGDTTFNKFIEMVEANLPDYETDYMQDRLEEDAGFDGVDA